MEGFVGPTMGSTTGFALVGFALVGFALVGFALVGFALISMREGTRDALID